MADAAFALTLDDLGPQALAEPIEIDHADDQAVVTVVGRPPFGHTFIGARGRFHDRTEGRDRDCMVVDGATAGDGIYRLVLALYPPTFHERAFLARPGLDVEL